MPRGITVLLLVCLAITVSGCNPGRMAKTFLMTSSESEPMSREDEIRAQNDNEWQRAVRDPNYSPTYQSNIGPPTKMTPFGYPDPEIMRQD